MAKIQNTGNRKFCAATGTLLLLLVGTQNGTATLEDSWQFLTKLNILLPYNLATGFLNIFPKELKT